MGLSLTFRNFWFVANVVNGKVTVYRVRFKTSFEKSGTTK
jgi:hypothetical protein